jgi:hypothetical protein
MNKALRTTLFRLTICTGSLLLFATESGGDQQPVNPIKVVILGPSMHCATASIDEIRLGECIEKALEKAELNVELYKVENFCKNLYPWFERSTAPKSYEALGELLNRPLIKKRIEEVGVQYLITWTGRTYEEPVKGPFFCGGGPGGAGCFGYGQQERRTVLSATVWDLQNITTKSSVKEIEVGKNIWIGFALPLPIIAATENPACIDLVSKIVPLLNYAKTIELQE